MRGGGLCQEYPTVISVRETLRAEGGGPTLMLQYRSQVWARGLAGGKGAGVTDAVAAVYQYGRRILNGCIPCITCDLDSRSTASVFLRLGGEGSA